MGWKTEESWFDYQQGQEIFLFLKLSSLQFTSVALALSLGVLQLRLDADHLPPASAKVQNG
jgi:hypothetical protein